jgi:hypothetical protein
VLQALPFEPLWKCEYGVRQHYGQGCLAPEIWKEHEHEIETLSVRHGSSEITVNPRKGLIVIDGAQASVPVVGKLIWGRTFRFDVGTHDKNTRSAPRCCFYEIGIKSESGLKGFRLFEDGAIEPI